MDAGQNEVLVGAAVFVGTVIATVIAYIVKKPPSAQHDAVIASVGLEIGNKQQQSEMNDHLKSMAESLRVLADRKQAGIEAKLDRLIEDLEEREDREPMGRRVR